MTWPTGAYWPATGLEPAEALCASPPLTLRHTGQHVDPLHLGRQNVRDGGHGGKHHALGDSGALTFWVVLPAMYAPTMPIVVIVYAVESILPISVRMNVPAPLMSARIQRRPP